MLPRTGSDGERLTLDYPELDRDLVRSVREQTQSYAEAHARLADISRDMRRHPQHASGTRDTERFATAERNRQELARAALRHEEVFALLAAANAKNVSARRASSSSNAAIAAPAPAPRVDQDFERRALHALNVLRADHKLQVEELRAENAALRGAGDSQQLAALRAENAALRAQLDAMQRRVAQVVVPTEVNAADLQFGAAKVEIGRGAAAVVYAATLRGESVAVKEMHGKAADIGNAAAQELAIAKRLIGHANIVTTFGVVQAADRLCLVMERLLNAVYVGLNQWTVQRLKGLWEKLPTKWGEALRRARPALQSQSNSAAMRAAVALRARSGRGRRLTMRACST